MWSTGEEGGERGTTVPIKPRVPNLYPFSLYKMKFLPLTTGISPESSTSLSCTSQRLRGL